MNATSRSELSARYEADRRSIKYHVKKFILRHRERFVGKVVVDAPAGSGITSRILRDVGAVVHPFDLFPEYFAAEGLTCRRANIVDGLPVGDASADIVFCQEGLEHFTDQDRVFQEFSRVIKPGGSVIITTPNYSNLQSRLSYFLFETEYLLKKMPLSEVDAVWMKSMPGEQRIYLGHVSLLGIQKLRLLAKLSGFRLKTIEATRISMTSLVLLPFAYPLLWLAAWWTYGNYIRRLRRQGGPRDSVREGVYRELMALNTNLRVLLDRHLFVEFEKEADVKLVREQLRAQHDSFDVIP